MCAAGFSDNEKMGFLKLIDLTFFKQLKCLYSCNFYRKSAATFSSNNCKSRNSPSHVYQNDTLTVSKADTFDFALSAKRLKTKEKINGTNFLYLIASFFFE